MEQKEIIQKDIDELLDLATYWGEETENSSETVNNILYG